MRWWSGRINRASYWTSLGLCAALYILLNLISKKQVAVSEVILVILCVPRLHDVGKSGWWAGGVVLAEIVLVVISFVTLPIDTATIPVGIFAIVVLGLLIWLGAIPGQPETNKYGEPPAPGVAFSGRRKV